MIMLILLFLVFQLMVNLVQDIPLLCCYLVLINLKLLIIIQLLFKVIVNININNFLLVFKILLM